MESIAMMAMKDTINFFDFEWAMSVVKKRNRFVRVPIKA